MPKIQSARRESDLLLSGPGTVVVLVALSSVIVLGAVCKYLLKLCHSVKERWKKRPKKRRSKQESRLRSTSVRRNESKTSKTREGGVAAPEFFIPSLGKRVPQQPSPNLVQGRTGRTNDDKCFRLMPLYFKDEIGELNPDLYQQVRAICLGRNKKLGQLNIKISYNKKSRNLSIFLVTGKDFPPRDYVGSIDTCVNITVLPDRDRRKQTAIHRRSVNPPYNENFVFGIQAGEDAHAHSLLLVTFFFDSYSHAHVLGECRVPLIYCDFSATTSIWCYLEESHDSETFLGGALQNFSNAECGELLISLCFDECDQTLTVAIMKGMKLTEGLFSNVDKLYTKATLFYEGKKLDKRKTGLKAVGEVFTVFNEALLFRVSKEKLPRCTLKVSVNHYNVMGKSATIGEVNFNAESAVGLEEVHWSSIISKHNNSVSMWHTLRGFKFKETLRDDKSPLSPP
ncbi:synaptotagmin-7-like isoform X1 [Acropora muricata]|uniref:synaptotagmin-7-like isoform X1 n=1 Tax=Acropora muricata TaxID=159855 RepID=UPI0034E50251